MELGGTADAATARMRWAILFKLLSAPGRLALTEFSIRLRVARGRATHNALEGLPETPIGFVAQFVGHRGYCLAVVAQ
jgi:hypothetical protein